MVEGFRRVAGEDVAQIAGRSYAGEDVPDHEPARNFAAFGPHLPDEAPEAGTPKNLPLNAHGMDLVRRLDIVDQLSRVASPALVSVGELDPVTRSPRPRRSPGPCQRAPPGSRSSTGRAMSRGWTALVVTGP